MLGQQFGVARPLADFLVGRSLPAPQLEALQALFEQDAAILEVVSLRAIYSGPEEVIVMAKIHPSSRLEIGQLTAAMDELDRTIRRALPLVADVFIDVTARHVEDASRAEEPRP